MNLTRMPLSLTAFAGVSLLGAHALADLPPAMGHLPKDAAMAFSVSNINMVVDGIERVTGAFGGMPQGGPLEALGAIRDLTGLDANGSAAAAFVFPPDFDPTMGEPDSVLIIPVTNYGELAEGLGGDASGVSEIFLQGQPMYMKSLGRGYAVACSTMERAQAFESGGSADAFESLMGRAGADLAERSQIITMFNMAPLAPMIAMGGMQMQQELGANMPIPGVDQMIGDLFTRLEEDGQAATIGVQFADSGVSMGVVAQFKSGSETAGYFQSGGSSTDLLGRLPDQPFFFALAVDSNNKLFEKVGGFMQDMQKMQAQMMGMPEPQGGILEHATGYAYSVGSPPGGIMGGLFAATTGYYRTDNVNELRSAIREATNALQQQEVPGVEMSGSYTENVLQVAGANVDTWGVNVQLDPNNPNSAQAQMAIQMLAGGPGFGGMFAPTDGGAVMTMSKNPDLLAKSIESARTGGGLSKNASIQDVAEFLPKSRSFELYIGTQDILQTAMQMMQMFGGAPPVELPAKLQPIAVAMGAREGAAEIGWFISNDTLDVFAQFGQAFGNMGGGMGDF